MALTKIDDRGLKTPIDLLDNEKLRLGTGNDLEIYHDGTNTFIKNNTGFLAINSDNYSIRDKDDGDQFIQALHDGAVELYHDGTKKLETTANGVNIESGTPNFQVKASTDGENAKLTLIGKTGSGGIGQVAIARIEAESRQSGNGASAMHLKTRKTNNTITTAITIDENQDINFPIDNQKLKVGASADLQIFHNGSHSRILDSGAGKLQLGSDTEVEILNGSFNETMAKFKPNGAVELYHDNALKFQTDSNGIIASGTEHKFTSSNSGDCKVIIEADADNDNEDDNPLLIFSQDGGLNVSAIGMGETGTSSDNVLTIANSVSNGGIGFATGTTNGYTNAVERMFLRTDGLLVINHGHSKLINESGLAVRSGGNTCVFKAEGAAGHNPVICWNNNESGTRQQIQFGDGASFGSRGSITTNGGNVSYGGTSDYRRKQDDVSITDGIEKIKLLKPKRFKWKDALDLGICDGFFAHEVQAVAPTSQAVIGTKDEVDSDGNPVYQQMDQSKLIPLLVAAVQELITKVETLEAA